jgi:4'-phosphopantetheinyl transferase
MPEPAVGEVRLWQAPLDDPPRPLALLWETLSADERARANRFRLERDRRRFAACRGLLRALLAPLVGQGPDALRFTYGARGKPALAGQEAADGLRFNVSHSDGVALYAVTRGRELGVDLEHVRPVQYVERIAERFFSTPERDALSGLPADLRLDGFFTCWTRKEAYVKARGEGLGYPLDRFAVTVVPGGEARLWAAGGADERETAPWSLTALPQPDGYIAALAVEGHDWRLSSAGWPALP